MLGAIYPKNRKGELAIANVQSIHEPEAELSTLEEALEDAEVMRAYLKRKQKIQAEPSVNLRVPL